jgi:iron complex outermembrane receptor protein
MTLWLQKSVTGIAFDRRTGAASGRPFSARSYAPTGLARRCLRMRCQAISTLNQPLINKTGRKPMSYPYNKLFLAMGALGAALGAAPNSALAQAPKGLEEVIVTARKTEENIQNIPVAITSLSSQDMVKNGVLNVKDINLTTPSMNITQASGNPVSARVSLRGQVQNDTVFTLDPSVGIYLDEIYVGRAPGAMLDFYDIQRVEILKGPQGTLYGRNTTGGAIKIITNRAETGGDLGGYVKGGVGNFNGKTVEGAINIPLIQDKLAARVAGVINKRDGYADNTIVDAVSGAPLETVATGDKNTQSARFDIVLNATDKLDIELQGDYSDLDTNGLVSYNKRGDVPADAQSFVTSQFFPTAGGPQPYSIIYGNGVGNFFGLPDGNYVRSTNDKLKATTNTKPYANNITWGTALTATYTFDNDMVAKAVYGHRKVDGKYAFDVDGTSLGIVNTYQSQGAKQDTVELQLSGDSDVLEWVAGLYWYKETGYEDSQSILFFTSATPQGALANPFSGTGENKSKSVYGQATWHITDTVSLTGGLRDTWDTKSYVSSPNENIPFGPGGFVSPGFCNFTAGAPGITVVTDAGGRGLVCESDQSKSYQHISWTAGIDWQVLDDVMVYLKSSNGYRAGGQNLRGTFAATLIPFDPEEVTDIEAGLKSTLWDNRLRANLAAYRSYYKDIQSTIFVTNPAGGPLSTQVVNLTDAEINGAELELTAQVIDELVLTGTASYTDTSYTKALTGADLASYPQGLQSTFTPRWKYSLGGTYTQPLSVGDLVFNVNYAWRDGYWANPSKANNQTPTARTDAIGLLNARITLEITSIDATIGVWGTNLADKEYVQNSLVFSAGGPTFVSTNPQEPRMFGVDVTKRF